MNRIAIIDENFNYTPIYNRCLADTGDLTFAEFEHWIYLNHRATFIYHPTTKYQIELDFEDEQDMLMFLLRYS